MKLKLDFPELRYLADRMGANESKWVMRDSGFTERKSRFIENLERGIQPTARSDFDAGFGILLAHKGEQIVLYIKDTRKDKKVFNDDPVDAVRFHVAECRTILRMKEDGRFDRYVMTNRADGKFIVETTDEITGVVETLEAPLYVCMNCLGELNWKCFHEVRNSEVDVKKSEIIWKEFSLSDFFAEFRTFFTDKPKYWDVTAPMGGYAKNWSKLADQFKRRRNWRCDSCKVDLSSSRGLLHGHHKNGDVKDNHEDNIAVLCVCCHARQPHHGRMKHSHAEEIKACQDIRNRQGIQFPSTQRG